MAAGASLPTRQRSMYCPRNSVRKGLGSRSKALLPSRKATAALGCGKATAKENASLDTGQKRGWCASQQIACQ